jgi:hypothetical protein
MADYGPNVYPNDGDLWGVMIRMLKIGATKSPLDGQHDDKLS